MNGAHRGASEAADRASTASSNRTGRRKRHATNPDEPRATLAQLLPFILTERPRLVLVLVLSIAGALAALAQPLLVSRLIDGVSQNQTVGLLAWGIAAFVVAAALLSGWQHYLLQRMGEGVVLTARRSLIRALLSMPIREYDQRRTGDLVSRVGSDTTLLRAVLTQGLVDAAGSSLTFLGAVVAMLIIDPILFTITVSIIALSVASVGLLAGRIRRASAAAQHTVGELAAALERALSAIRTIRAAGATERESADIEAHAESAWRNGVTIARISALVVPVAGVALQVSLLAVLGVGGFRVASGAITVGNLVAFVLFLFLLLMPLGQVFGAITSVNQALGALGRIQQVLDVTPETADEVREGGGAARSVALGSGGLGIQFVDVSFHYTADEPVLRDVSFEAKPGTRVAFVGPSGAGKSTILSLIERFYEPSSGQVLLGGVDIRDLPRSVLRAQIGYVEQDAPVLAGTLRSNLTLAAPGASDADCVRVLHDVNLGGVLGRDPAGLDALVGEHGVKLSGGERQRLAIARALLAAPPVLLLDESTSSLDSTNEQLMRAAIDRVSEGRTVLVVAHRLSTIVDADHILVCQAGQIVGRGTHSSLLESSPLYRELAAHQLLV